MGISALPPRVLVINPSGEEGLGICGKVLREEGASVDEVAAKESVDLLLSNGPSPSVRVVSRLPGPGSSRRYDCLVVLGSPLGVLTPGAEGGTSSRSPKSGDPQTPAGVVAAIEELIRDFHAREKPVLGLCLGAQLIARSFGGAVFKLPRDEAHTAMPVRLAGQDEQPLGVEFGWHAQEFTKEAEEDHVVGPALRAWRSGLPPATGGGAAAPSLAPKFAQWHSDTFVFPKGAVVLSRRPTCPAQAFRLNRWTYAFQYHIEVDQEMAEEWYEDYLEGNDSYADKGSWEGVSQDNAKAMRAELASVVAEGSVARAERFTRAVMRGLLGRATAARREQAAQFYGQAALAAAVAALAVAAAVVVRSNRKTA